MWGTLQTGTGTQHLWETAAILGVVLLGVVGLVVYLLRKFFQSTKEEHKERIAVSAPRTENPSAFMAASMQAVIQQLREQEKELERRHKIERDRAKQTALSPARIQRQNKFWEFMGWDSAGTAKLWDRTRRLRGSWWSASSREKSFGDKKSSMCLPPETRAIWVSRFRRSVVAKEKSTAPSAF